MADFVSKPVRRRASVKPPFTAPEAIEPMAAGDHLPMIDPTHPSAADPAGFEPKDDTMATTFENTAETVQSETTTAANDFAGRAKGAMDKGTQMVGEMTDFAKGNVEAIVESTGIYARGLESFGQDAAAFAKKSYEDATAAMKAMTAAKSPTELFKLHSEYTRQAFDAMVAETSKSTEKMVKLVGEAVQPISNRVSLAAEKVKIAA
jgi:phasin family protein